MEIRPYSERGETRQLIERRKEYRNASVKRKREMMRELEARTNEVIETEDADRIRQLELLKAVSN